MYVQVIATTVSSKVNIYTVDSEHPKIYSSIYVPEEKLTTEVWIYGELNNLAFSIFWKKGFIILPIIIYV